MRPQNEKLSLVYLLWPHAAERRTYNHAQNNGFCNQNNPETSSLMLDPFLNLNMSNQYFVPGYGISRAMIGTAAEQSDIESNHNSISSTKGKKVVTKTTFSKARWLKPDPSLLKLDFKMTNKYFESRYGFSRTSIDAPVEQSNARSLGSRNTRITATKPVSFDTKIPKIRKPSLNFAKTSKVPIRTRFSKKFRSTSLLDEDFEIISDDGLSTSEKSEQAYQSTHAKIHIIPARGTAHLEGIRMSKHLKPDGYQWLSKSSKRRARKQTQKQMQEEDHDYAELARQQNELTRNPMPHQRQYESLQSISRKILVKEIAFITPSPRLAQWRKRRLQKGTDPFSKCYGTWQHFVCGHRIQVLCESCALAWDTGRLVTQCPTYFSTRTGLVSTHDDTWHFKERCPKCPAKADAVSRYKKPWVKNYPYEAWLTTASMPIYVPRDRVRVPKRMTTLNVVLFYVIQYDTFSFIPY